MIWTCALAATATIITGLEFINYLQYKSIKSIVDEENNYNGEKNVDGNFWVNKLTRNDLLDWITGTCDKELENINRESALEFVIYYTYYKKSHNIDDIQYIKAMNILKKIEQKMGHNFYSDKYEKINITKFGYDNVNIGYKPLIFYSGVNIATNFTYMYLKYYGFIKNQSNSGNFTYFYKHCDDDADNVIFIHGLGFGIMPYISFIFELMKDNNVIIPILPNISNMEFHKMGYNIDKNDLFPDYDTWRDDFLIILKKYGKSHIIGHSFGTVMMGILLKHSKIDKKVLKRVFIDPVCFFEKSFQIMKYIDNPHNDNIIDNIFNAIVYNDIYVKYTTKRFLVGPEFWIMDYENMTENNFVILSENDNIVPSINIWNKLGQYCIPCMLVSNAIHGEIFFSQNYKEVINTLLFFIKSI